MNKKKYRDFDYLANIIISSKIKNYSTINKTKLNITRPSFKKMELINIKIFDKTKNNNRTLNNNDRIDLYLQGDQLHETRKSSSKFKFKSQQPLYKLTKPKKIDIIHSQNSHLHKTYWPSSSVASKKTEETRLNNKQMQIRTISREQRSADSRKCMRKFNSKDLKKGEEFKVQKRMQLTIRSPIKSVSDQEIDIKKRKPLFYLQPKQISHIKAESFIVSEFPSGQVITGNYYKKTAEIASLTKIMTFFTIYKIAEQFSKDLNLELIEIDEEAQEMTGTSAEVFVGDIYTVKQLLFGLMLPSGNDAATALAKWGGRVLLQNQATQIDNPVKRFIIEMNIMAKKLDLKSTKFGNPHGLPSTQSGSNPEDLSILICECLKIDLFREVVRTKKFSDWITDTEGMNREIVWQNTNKLLRRPGFMGVKTGVTITAGPCLATCYEVKERIFIVVLLRTNKLSRRFKETRLILSLALSKLDRIGYGGEIREMLREDVELDSDNSEEEEEFNYERSDAKEMQKRNKILSLQM